MNNTFYKISAVILFFLICDISFAGDDDDATTTSQTRVFGELVYSPIKKLDLSLSPEIRFNEEWGISKYFIQTGAEYQVFDFMSLGGDYRFVINPREKKGTEYLHEYKFGLTFSQSFNRFKPSLRIMYSNNADDNDDEDDIPGNFLRTKAKLKYNIKNCKLTPLVAVEAIQGFDDLGLYKWRYTAGLDYKLSNKNRIGLYYKFDKYADNYRKHIITVGYKFKF